MSEMLFGLSSLRNKVWKTRADMYPAEADRLIHKGWNQMDLTPCKVFLPPTQDTGEISMAEFVAQAS